jgi:hypothetical protein
MTTDLKKPGWQFWTIVALSLRVLYVASFGPAAWIALRTSDRTAETIMASYVPLGFAGQAVAPFGSFLE